MSDSVKGTYENPYSFKEYEDLVNAGEWKGGWVRYETGVYYAGMGGTAYGSLGCDGSDSGSDSGSDYYGSDELGSDTTNIETPGQPGDSTNTNPGRGGGGGTGGVNSGGGIPSGGGSSHSGGNEYPNIPDVLSTDKFSGYRNSDKKGCFNRCKEMLAAGHGNWSGGDGNEILMANSDSTGQATTAASSFEEGLDYIDNQLKQGKPVIVTVDYQPGKSMGGERKDKAGDHFVIIVGGSRTSGYHYFDPATANQGRGTSTDNKFTMQGNLLKDVNNCRGEGKEYEKNYTLTCVRY